MISILTDSMARDHAMSMQATAAASQRAREVRSARRELRAAERTARAARAGRGDARRGAKFGHAAAHPFSAAHDWLAAGQL